MNKNPKEYWNILKSFKKKSNEQENIPEILKDESVIIELHYLTTVVCIFFSFSS
jgi:hypothetical protein